MPKVSPRVFKQGKWSQEDTDYLKSRWIQGTEVEELSKYLGRSRQAVYAKSKELGLTVDVRLNKNNENNIKRCYEAIELCKNYIPIHKAIAKVGMGKRLFKLTLDKSEELKEEYSKLKEYLNNTYKCYMCKNIFNDVKYIGIRKAKRVRCNECNKKYYRQYRYKNLQDIDKFFRQMSCKIRSRSGGLQELTYEFLKNLYNKQEGKCYYTGKKMVLKKRNFDLISIDRKDSNKGYFEDNVVLCRFGINVMKSNMEIDRFIKVCKQIVDYMGKKDEIEEFDETYKYIQL